MSHALTPFKVTDTMTTSTSSPASTAAASGPVRRAAPRHRPPLLAAGDYRAELKKAGDLARRPYGRAQEVRSEEGPQAPAVQQALRFVLLRRRGRASLSLFRESGRAFRVVRGAKPPVRSPPSVTKRSMC